MRRPRREAPALCFGSRRAFIVEVSRTVRGASSAYSSLAFGLRAMHLEEPARSGGAGENWASPIGSASLLAEPPRTSAHSCSRSCSGAAEFRCRAGSRHLSRRRRPSLVLVFTDVSFAKDPRPPCRPADVREGLPRVETAASARPRAFSRAPLPDMFASPTGLSDMFARAARAPSVRSSFAYPCSSAPRKGARYT